MQKSKTPPHSLELACAFVSPALCSRTFKEHCLIFLPTKKAAHRMRIIFGLLDLKATELHGALSQLQVSTLFQKLLVLREIYSSVLFCVENWISEGIYWRFSRFHASDWPCFQRAWHWKSEDSKFFLWFCSAGHKILFCLFRWSTSVCPQLWSNIFTG